MNRQLLLVLASLCLTACAGQTVRDDSPASDLDALETNARVNLEPRTLPNGKLYCLELTETQKQRDACAGDLEDGFFLAEQDKAAGLADILRGIDRLRLARNPCGFWAKLFRRDRCTVKEKPP